MNVWKTNLWLTALVVTVVTASVAAQERTNEQAELLLQEAKHKALVDGDLQQAIKLCEKIVAEHASDRPAVAKALVRMGSYYEKLGRDEARKTYLRVVEQFADQRQQADVARIRLAALGHAEQATGPTARLVWPETPDWNFAGSPSPDGKYVSYVDQDTANLGVRELATGKNRLLTKDEGYVGASVFSPDGSKVAYTCFVDGHYELRTIAVDGGESRTVYRADDGWINLHDWSPDTESILALVVRPSNDADELSIHLATIRVADGSIYVVKSLDHATRVRARFSPDGSAVAYSSRPTAESRHRDVYLMSVEGGKETLLVRHPANDDLVDWSPDGKRIVFTSDRSGPRDLWALAITDGQAAGAPQPLKTVGAGFHPMGITSDGTLYYGMSHHGSNVYSANLDPETLRLIGEPTRAIRQAEGTNWAPDWSHDGRYLACISWMPGEFQGIQILELETGTTRKLITDLDGVNVHSLYWSPDGKSLLVWGGFNGPWGAQSVDVQTGKVTTLAREIRPNPQWSVDGKAIFVNRHDEEMLSLARVDLETGEQKEIHRTTMRTGTTLSPDGQHFLFRQKETLMLLPAAGGELRELLRIEGGRHYTWMPDSKNILYLKYDEERKKQDLFRVSIDGGDPEKLGSLDMPEFTTRLRVHPDGKRIAFRATTSEERAEVWALENFLPPVATQ